MTRIVLPLAALLLLSCSESAPPAPPRVVLIALEGADPDLTATLMDRDALPALTALRDRGANGKMRAEPPLLAPVIWTTVATGVEPTVHGVAGFAVEDWRSGKILPLRSQQVLATRVWEIAAARGRPSAAVGWPGTWPVAADAVATVISDVALQVPEALPPGAVSFGMEGRLSDVASRAFSEDRDDLATGLAVALLRDAGCRFVAVHLDEVDRASHEFMPYAPPRQAHVHPLDFRREATEVRKAYRRADGRVARIVEAAGRNATVLVVSGHGFRTGVARPRESPSRDSRGAANWHRQYGLLIAAGPGIRPGTTVRGSTISDVVPTVLALLGLPVASDFAGRPIPEIPAAGPQPDPVESFSSLADTEATDLGGSAMLLDDDASRGLSDLARGRLKEAETHLSKAIKRTPGSATLRFALGSVYQRTLRWEEAEAEFAEAARHDPTFTAALLRRAAALSALRRPGEALVVATAAAHADPTSEFAHLQLAHLLLEAGRRDEALRELGTVLRLEPDFPLARYRLALARIEDDRLDEATTELRRALDLRPDYPEAWNALSVALLRLSARDPAARPETEKVIQEVGRRYPDDSRPLFHLAQFLLLSGEEARALELLDRVVKQDPAYQEAKALRAALRD